MSTPEELFDCCLDGTLSSSELDQLEAWISESPLHAKMFLEWAAIHLDTKATLRSEVFCNLMVSANELDADEVIKSLQSPSPTGHPSSRTSKHRFHRIITSRLALAVSLLCVLSSTWFFYSLYASETPDYDASVVATVDCRWTDEAKQVGDRLYAGDELHLEQGLVELSFECGARFVLEGPASFTINDAMSASLNRGKLSAEVLPRASGFLVQTPSSKVVDLGTEFGIDVGDDGRSEVHVFRGEVISWPFSAENSGEKLVRSEIRLGKDEAIKFDAKFSSSPLFQSEEKLFKRNFYDRGVPEGGRSLPITDDLALQGGEYRQW